MSHDGQTAVLTGGIWIGWWWRREMPSRVRSGFWEQQTHLDDNWWQWWQCTPPPGICTSIYTTLLLLRETLEDGIDWIVTKVVRVLDFVKLVNVVQPRKTGNIELQLPHAKNLSTITPRYWHYIRLGLETRYWMVIKLRPAKLWLAPHVREVILYVSMGQPSHPHYCVSFQQKTLQLSITREANNALKGYRCIMDTGPADPAVIAHWLVISQFLQW